MAQQPWLIISMCYWKKRKLFPVNTFLFIDTKPVFWSPLTIFGVINNSLYALYKVKPSTTQELPRLRVVVVYSGSVKEVRRCTRHSPRTTWSHLGRVGWISWLSRISGHNFSKKQQMVASECLKQIAKRSLCNPSGQARNLRFITLVHPSAHIP